MVSITGSTRAGMAVAKSAADIIKRVHQVLGGKSANIISTTRISTATSRLASIAASPAVRRPEMLLPHGRARMRPTFLHAAIRD
jgi:hypothetical protein